VMQARWAERLQERGEDAAVVRRWREEAARGGEPDVMLRLGWEDERAGRRVDAQEWYRGAAMFGSDIGGIAYAQMVMANDDRPAAAAHAVRVLADIDSVDARQTLAMLYLHSDRVAPDPARARELLEADA